MRVEERASGRAARRRGARASSPRGSAAGAVVEAASRRARAGAPAPRRPLLRLALVSALLAVALAAAADARRRGGGRLDREADRARPRGDAADAARASPSGGRLLAVSDSGAWVVNPGGGVRRLGDYSQVGWSPRGLYVLGTRGHRITAMEPDGEPRWSFSRPGRLSGPAWSGRRRLPGGVSGTARRDAVSLRVADGSGAARPPRRALGGGRHAGLAAGARLRRHVRDRGGRPAHGRRRQRPAALARRATAPRSSSPGRATAAASPR